VFVEERIVGELIVLELVRLDADGVPALTGARLPPIPRNRSFFGGMGRTPDAR
jgi:hypothetical protein